MQNQFDIDVLLLNAPIGIAVMNYEGNYLATNPAYNAIYGYSDGELIGQSVAVVFPDDMKARVIQLHKNFLDKGGQLGGEWEVVRRDGQHLYVMSQSIALKQPNGEIYRFVYVTDITERKRAEMIQNKLNKDLAASNDELQRFSYVASHDLKSPLRGIDQLANWITQDLGDNLSAETRNHLRLMRSRISRMNLLLDDLLTYSRVGRSDDKYTNVNTRTLLEDIFDLMACQKSFRLDLADDLPLFYTQKAPLDLVFRNLIGNAIKHHDKPQGTISVSARAIANAFEFTVQDDGPGIPIEFQEKVFAMFQTLKPRDEVEGSGMGLSIVKKTVESLGGSVTLESDGHHGCTFKFTWPISITQ